MKNLNILVVGSGGREHALAHRLAQEGHGVFVSPGNPGMELVSSVKIHRGEKVDLVAIGPEAPLARGQAQDLRQQGLAVVGPGKQGAQLEASKAWAKDFMAQFSIPRAYSQNFTDKDSAIRAIKQGHFGDRPVVKLSGLWAGKGVFVCQSVQEAVEKIPGLPEGESLVIEEFLPGPEASAFALVNESGYHLLGLAQDRKRLLEGNHGPNTGGMGAVITPGAFGPSLVESIEREILGPTWEGIQARGISYRGALFMGLVIGPSGRPSVLEFNVRFGDPESQVLFPLLEGSLGRALWETSQGAPLEERPVVNPHKSGVCVVMASRGYGTSEEMLLGHRVEFPSSLGPGEHLFFAGVARGDAPGELVNSSGRVLGATGLGESLEEARSRAYGLAHRVDFEGKYFRRDI